jgi:signal transduction histidine kinase
MKENEPAPTCAGSRNQNNFNVSRSHGLALAVCLLAGSIFSLDLALPLGALAGMPYTIVVILGWFAEGCYFTLATSAAMTLLTIAGHTLSPHAADPQVDFANRAIALVAIWCTAALLFQARRQAAANLQGEASLYRKLRETRSELEVMRSAQLRLEQLAAMGEKAGTTAHELRNPLGVIATSMSVIEFKTRQTGLDVSKSLERAHRAIRRCEHIIDEQLDQARALGHHPETVRIDDWLSGLIEEMEISNDTSVTVNLNAHGVAAEIDQDSFRRVLINLVDNAVQALSETPTERNITIGTNADQDGAEIYVEDNGPGIAPHLLDHVTEVLVSTKPYGTGLGLPTVQRIIDEHGGAMTIESQPQHGTRVTLRLPKSPTP